MQISDLNTNLLNMVTGQNSNKSEDNRKDSGFMDLLQLSGADKADSSNNMDLQTERRQDTGRTSAQNDAPKTELKKTDKQENKSKTQDAPKAEKKEQQEKQDGSVTTSVKENAESRETVQGTSAKEVAQVENDVQNVIVPVQPLLFDFSDETVVPELNLVTVAESSENPVSVENMPVEQIVLPEENNLQLPKQDVVEDVEIPDAEPVVAEENTAEVPVAQPQEKELKPEEKEGRVQAEKVKDVIGEQEEKIAELLPEDKKVEIKVSVKEDKVTALESKNKISFETMSVVDDVVETDVVEADVVEDVSDVKMSEIKAEAVQAAPIVMDAIQAEVPANNIDGISEIQVASNIANDVRPQNVTVKTDNFNSVQDKGLTREVAEQVKVNITQSAVKGVDKIEIQLKPADLGQVEIKLHIGKDGKIQAHIIASNAETLEILQKESAVLKDAFTNAGYQAEDGSFSFSHRGGEQNDEREKLREFIGEVLTQDVAEELAANDYIREDGVNIRV